MGQRSQIIALLQGSAPGAYRFFGSLQPPHGPGSLAVQGDGGHSGEPGGAPVEGGNRFTVGTGGKKGHLQLLYGIAVIMALKCQFHRQPPR